MSDSRQSLVFTVLVAVLVGVIIAVPPATRTDDVGRRPSQRIFVPGRGFAPGPDASLGPGVPTPPSTTIDRSGPACTALATDVAQTIVATEQESARTSDAIGTPPIEGSRPVYAVPKAGESGGVEGAPLGSTPATATPILGTPYVVTAGAFGGPLARTYAAVERYDAATGSTTPVLVLGNCDQLTAAVPHDPDDASAHLWLAAGTQGSTGQTILEVDPVGGRVVWSMPTALQQLTVVDAGAHVLVVDHGGSPEVLVLDSSTHAVVGSYVLGDRDLLTSPPGQLWATATRDQHAALVQLDPVTGAETRSFDLTGVVRAAATDVLFSGGAIWTQDASALVRRDAVTFAEQSRVDTGSARFWASAGPNDVWVQIDRTTMRDGAPAYEVELRHLDGRTAEVRSSSRVRSGPRTTGSTDPSADFLPLQVDGGGFWYESRRRVPDEAGTTIEGSETLFRFDGQ